jgi:hypothetical protein
MWKLHICFVWVYVGPGKTLETYKWFFDLFAESYNNALGIGLKLSVHPLFAKSNALG